MTDYLKKGAKGLIIVFAFSFLGNIFGYLTRTILTRVIEPSDFGLFYSVFSLAMFVILFATFGFGSALPKFMAQCIAKGHREKLKHLIRFTTTFRVALSVMLAIVLALITPWLAQNYYHTDKAVPILYIFCIIIPLLLFARILFNILQGYQENFWLGVLGFAEKFLFFVFVAAFVLAGFTKNAILPTYAFLVGIALTCALFVPIILLKSKILQERFTKLSKKFKGLVWKFALASIVTAIGYMTIGYIDTILLTYFVDLAQVGIYNTVLPTMMVLGFFTKVIHSVYFPMTSELWAKKLTKKLIDGISLLEKYSLFIIIPVALTTLFFPAIILTVLFGEAYAVGALAMQLLSLGIIFSTLGVIYQSTLSGIGFPKEVTKIVITGAVLNVIGNIALIPRFGIEGAAITTTVSYLYIMVFTFVRLKTKLPVRVHLGYLAKFTGAAIIFIAPLYALKTILTLHPILEAVIAVTIAGLLYVGACLLFKIITIQEVKKLFKTVVSKTPIQTSAE